MLGIQRFFSMLFCLLIVMILFPDFGMSGWTFAGTIALVWTGVILIMSLVDSLFGLYRFGGINRFLTWVFLGAVIFSMLFLFPQDDAVSPINKLKYGQLPNASTIKRGIDKFSFNFAFDKRRAQDKENFINQRDKKAEADQAAQKAEELRKRQAAEKAKQKLVITVE